MPVKLTVIFFAVIISEFSRATLAEDADDDYEYDYEVETDASADETVKKVHRPVINSQPTHVRVSLGGIISLPCTTDFLSESVQLIWSKLSETQVILVVGETVLPSTTKRISVKVTSNGSTLVIEDVEEDDYGHYQCKVAVQGEDAPQIVHTVSKIEHQAKRQNFETIHAEAGDDINLSCTAVADPEPTIFWSKENEILPGGMKTIVGTTLTLKTVTEKDGGTYICTAANGLSKPVENKIVVIVDGSDDNFIKRDLEQGKLQRALSSGEKLLTINFFGFFYILSWCFFVQKWNYQD